MFPSLLRIEQIIIFIYLMYVFNMSVHYSQMFLYILEVHLSYKLWGSVLYLVMGKIYLIFRPGNLNFTALDSVSWLVKIVFMSSLQINFVSLLNKLCLLIKKSWMWVKKNKNKKFLFATVSINRISADIWTNNKNLNKQ